MQLTTEALEPLSLGRDSAGAIRMNHAKMRSVMMICEADEASSADHFRRLHECLRDFTSSLSRRHEAMPPLTVPRVAGWRRLATAGLLLCCPIFRQWPI